MGTKRSAIDAVRPASPCTVPWESMAGDERRRFCGQCRLHVYDVAGLTRREAGALLLRSEGRVCARLTVRADGTLVTKDCGRVREAIARRLRWVRVAAAAVLGAVGLTSCRPSATGPQGGAPNGQPGPSGFVTTGAICLPPPPEAPVPAPPPAGDPR